MVEKLTVKSDSLKLASEKYIKAFPKIWGELNKLKGEQNNMNTQYEIAKMVTKNQISDERIDRELASLSQEEWDEQCIMLDKMMREHIEKRKDKPAEDVMLQDLINVGTANNVSATTVWIAYLKWLDVEYTVPNKV